MTTPGTGTYDRRYALVALIFALAYGFGGSQFEVGFYNGIIGPHHWIYGVAGVLALMSVWLLLQPTAFVPEEESWEAWRKRIPLCLAIILYTQGLPYVGFLITMTALMVLVSMLFGANWKQAAVCAVVLSGLCLLLFDGLLGISLGRGLWFR
jgi:hypothetical protein